jgi:hypothetical protein
MKGAIRGAKEMTAKLRQIATKFPERVEAAIYQEAQIEATEMKRRTPVDITEDAPHPGNLRNSIHVEEPERQGKIISVTVATGAQAPYAIYVHENPDAIHPVGEWKFMESVLNESRSSMAGRIARRVDLNEMRL